MLFAYSENTVKKRRNNSFIIIKYLLGFIFSIFEVLIRDIQYKRPHGAENLKDQRIRDPENQMYPVIQNPENPES
jgi:hypothetical protein